MCLCVCVCGGARGLVSSEPLVDQLLPDQAGSHQGFLMVASMAGALMLRASGGSELQQIQSLVSGRTPQCH